MLAVCLHAPTTSCALASASAGAMPPDPSSCTFSSLFNQLKHLRCHQDIGDLVYDVRRDRDFDFFEPVDGIVDVEALQGSELEHVSQSLTDPCRWRPVFMKSLGDGIVIVPEVLNLQHRKAWFNRLVHDYPRNTGIFRSNTDLQSLTGDNLQSNLRWLTFGYHYLWDTKEYEFNHPNPVPDDLDNLFRALARILHIDFEPQAGIINYYTCKSRLSPHADVAELNATAPLFSLSLGGSAIFMVGGCRKEDEPVAPILLADGDLVVMRAERRLSFHAVPKIYCAHASSPSFQKECPSGIVRVNINARQVF